MSALATLFAGTRTPIVVRPAATLGAIQSDLGKTIVSGPGQKRSANTEARAGQSLTQRLAITSSCACTMSGFVAGRPFASKMRCTARGLVASAPRP
jgi:hypothetical protein